MSKFENFLFAFGQNGPQKMFNDLLVGNQTPSRPNFVILKSCHTEIFLKGVNPWFLSKIENLLFVRFWTKIGPKLKFVNHLFSKQAILD